MKKVILAIFSLFSLSLLTACSTDSKVESDNKNNQIKADDQQDLQTEIIQSEPVNNPPLLAINSSCIGCGRCAVIDPSHFDMSGQKAIVASQDNLDSSKILQAIESCPASAISL